MPAEFQLEKELRLRRWQWQKPKKHSEMMLAIEERKYETPPTRCGSAWARHLAWDGCQPAKHSSKASKAQQHSPQNCKEVRTRGLKVRLSFSNELGDRALGVSTRPITSQLVLHLRGCPFQEQPAETEERRALRHLAWDGCQPAKHSNKASKASNYRPRLLPNTVVEAAH